MLAALLRILTALVLSAAVTAARADEVITDYRQTVEVGTTDLLTVTEEITVRAEGREIRRGIYRDFPTRYEDDQGRLRRVGFEVMSVERDGRPEPYTTTRGGAGVRIKIGDPDVHLSDGLHTYRIVYETTRQIRRFDDYDEVYWNVTGTEWTFPIVSVSARIVLPPSARILRHAAYTGYYGEQGTDAAADVDGREARFRTTRTLQPGEGLTVAVAFPKGVVALPTSTDRWSALLDEYRTWAVGVVGLLAVLLYYVWAWNRVGRDPPRGTVIPQFDAPPGISPALAHYVHEQGLTRGGWVALSAAVLDLAVKGLITLEDLDGDLRMTRTDAPVPADLAAPEKAILSWLTGQGGSARIDRANGPAVERLGNSFRGAVTRENRDRFFVKNRRWVFGGLLLTLVVVAAEFMLGQPDPTEASVTWAAMVGGVMVFLILRSAFAPGRIGFFEGIRRLGLLWVVLMILGGVGTIVYQSVSGFGDLPALPILAVAAVVLNGVFMMLMSAPTALGRKVMDAVEGLHLFLSVAEADRLNMAGAPAVTPSRYETLLPYAIALGVEKPWTEALHSWLATSAAAAGVATYQPTWYHGRSFSPDRFSQTVESLPSTFASAVPPPKSSSSGSGGGGFSGGGGGGGGGGGW